MKIWICAYRDWALEVYESLISTNYQVELISSKEQFDKEYKKFKKKRYNIFYRLELDISG